MYNNNSPNTSSTSLSDNDDEEVKDLQMSLVPCYPTDVSPALWSSTHHRQRPKTPPHCPISRLPPELLIHTLKQLHSTRDLHSSLLVSRAWCECAVELLWHRPSLPDLTRLVQMLTVICAEEQTFQYARFVRRLNFLSLGRDLTDVLFTRLEKCVKLERLTLVNCSEITDNALFKVLPLCPNLVALDLTNLTSTTDKSIIALAQSATRLQGINLGGCKNITDVGVLALAAHCPLLRRIKLSGVKNITDRSVSAMVKSCPLLLEFDLNGCPKITDVSVRDLWMHLTHSRELRLAHCAELTDAAFPATAAKQAPASPTGPNPFPQSQALASEPLPPLKLARMFEHLRMLDLTACQLVTDDAIEGIVTSAPKIRNLVLAKCSLLTDTAVESICKLGKHLHYLHLGHAASITDRSVKTLARSCTRLRYIDLACCPLLTDMSVFELSGLPKLRRIGLVHVSNLTDQAIFSLADRHSTLERIHLSYCEQITVLAVHFLLQRLAKLTHLSLTGIPAFRRPELQQFCRSPPKEFNTSQRAAFCVYSGKGVNDLRKYLADLMESVQAEVDAVDNDTDYEGEDEEDSRQGYESEREQDCTRTRYMEEVEIVQDILTPFSGEFNESASNSGNDMILLRRQRGPDSSGDTATMHVSLGNTSLAPAIGGSVVSDANLQDTNPSSVATTPGGGQANTEVATPIANRRLDMSQQPRFQTRVFGQEPIIEQSSPPPGPRSQSPSQAYSRSNASDVASNRSSGTNNSNGAGFFRTYTDAPVLARNGACTPDLVFAEIGHGIGRGREGVAGPGPSTVTMMQNARRFDYQGAAGGHETVRPRPPFPYPALDAGVMPMSQERRNTYPYDRDRDHALTDASNSYHRAPLHESPAAVWPHQEPSTTPIPYLSSSPTTRELQESVHSAFAGSGTGSRPDSGVYEGDEQVQYDARGRSVKRSLRNTLSAAEQYASAFFFGGRGASSSSMSASMPVPSARSRGRTDHDMR